MDPITIALAALNLGATGYNYYNQRQLTNAQNAFGTAQGQAQIRAAEAAKAQYQDELSRRRRMLAENLSSRGVGESTIATDDMNYLNRGAERDLRGLTDNVRLSRQGLRLFRNQIGSQRRGNYINLGTGIVNALGGAYTAMKPTTFQMGS